MLQRETLRLLSCNSRVAEFGRELKTWLHQVISEEEVEEEGEDDREAEVSTALLTTQQRHVMCLHAHLCTYCTSTCTCSYALLLACSSAHRHTYASLLCWQIGTAHCVGMTELGVGPV